MPRKLPWEMPDIAYIGPEELAEERRANAAYGATIEGGCWFSHIGGIDVMEKEYGRRNRERDERPAPGTVNGAPPEPHN